MSIKVSQATIDKIKAMGMTKALKSASGASPETKEALTRMYGARRVAANTKSTAKSTSTGGHPRSAVNKGTPVRPVSKSAASKPADKPKTNTTSNPATALHNKLSPFGDKSQTYASGASATGLSGRRSRPGKPSIGEQISSAVGGAIRGKGLPSKVSASSVAATNAKRMGISVAEYNKRLNAKKKKSK